MEHLNPDYRQTNTGHASRSWHYPALLLLLAVAALLRFYDLGSRSYFNDELSALYRLEGHTGVKELVVDGVTPDFHPAGVQVLLWYWQKVVGDQPFLMRLPFAMAGVVSVWLVFLLGIRWFGRSPAWMAAASLALLQFPLLYAQVIRPYSTGMMLILVAALCWDRIVFSKENTTTKRLLLPAAGLALSFAGAMYNHYFSFLMAALIGFTGLLLVRRKHLPIYLAAGVVPLLLFLPHLQITIDQVSRGGLSTWLPPPQLSWVKEHLLYLFNGSGWLTLTIIVPAIILLVRKIPSTQEKPNTTRLLVAGLWYIVPFTFAFIYSVAVNPIIQHSIMLFAFPFLLLALFAGFGESQSRMVMSLTIILPLLMIAQLLLDQRYYQHTPYTNFKALGKEICIHTSKDAAWMVDVNHPWYIHYYLEGGCTNDSALLYRLTGHDMLPGLHSMLDTLSSERLVYAWMRPADPLVPSVIRQHYPYLVSYQSQVPYSELFVFSRTPDIADLTAYTRDTILLTVMDHPETLLDGAAGAEFLPVHEGALPLIGYGRGNILLHCKAEFLPGAPLPADLTLVIHGVHSDGTPGEWFGIKLNLTRTDEGEAFHTVALPHDFNPQYPIKVYLWNPGKEPYQAKKISLYWLRDPGKSK